jgi:hypothetical protein
MAQMNHNSQPSDIDDKSTKPTPNDHQTSLNNSPRSHNTETTKHRNANKRRHSYDDNEELLDFGLLPHHEYDTFSMNEDEIQKTCHPRSWSNCDATTFEVRRGPNYVSGQKSPSKNALYTVFAMDAYKNPQKINKIFKFMKVQKYIADYCAQHSYVYDRDTYPLPPLFILNCMVPDYAPELMSTKSDGNGYQLILYAHMTEQTKAELDEFRAAPKQYKLPPSLELLNNFIHSDLVHSEIRNRFKVIVRIMNSKYTDFGFLANRLVKRYNGKPFLARTSSTFYHEPGKYFAADIDAHLFGYPARQGLSYVKNSIQTAIYDAAFVIEGVKNTELPEQILCCCRISKMGIDVCKNFPEPLMKKYIAHKHYNESKDDTDLEATHAPPSMNGANSKSRSTSHLVACQGPYDNDENDQNDENEKNAKNENSGTIVDSSQSQPHKRSQSLMGVFGYFGSS